ncbi:hypothetical protein ACR71G_22435 [Xenorhabdus bovienii]|uniref:hypothetical protein n=1 Tax=Xenorhabdus bovienii TaxID=40576 RepID=UPI003DA5A4A8
MQAHQINNSNSESLNINSEGMSMKKTQEILLAATELAEKMEEILEARGLNKEKEAVIEALKAALNCSRQTFLINEHQPY